MKIVRVTYTARLDYVSQNTANIQQVMQDLEAINHPGITYFVCLGADGKTFTHTAFFASDEDQKILLTLPAFNAFQTQLKASMPEVPPQQEVQTMVGAAGLALATSPSI